MISQKFHDLKEKCQKVKFIPVLALNEVSSAVDIAKVMVDAGLNVLEITLRTPQAWEILDKIKNALPDAIIGAGTILNEEQMLRAKNMELSFIVSPGSTIELMDKAIELDIPYLPGCVTASEVLNAHSRGYDFLKFFPAHAFGCVNVLKGFSGPFKNIDFCPTGGVNVDNVEEFLQLKNVICCGGSWLVTEQQQKDKSYRDIEKKAREIYNIVHSYKM